MDTVIRNGAGCLLMNLGVTGCGFNIVPNESVSDSTRTLGKGDFEIAICDVSAFLEERGEIRMR